MTFPVNAKTIWKQTYTGRKFYPFDPRIEDICFEDISHALSLICRFNGHCLSFYSVAEHSVRMALADLPGDPISRLFHDAAEAYLGDITTPIKACMPWYRRHEDRLLSMICDRFSVPYPDVDVKYADGVMLATEKRDLMSIEPDQWIPLPSPLPDTIIPWPWEYARYQFNITALNLGVCIP